MKHFPSDDEHPDGHEEAREHARAHGGVIIEHYEGGRFTGYDVVPHGEHAAPDPDGTTVAEAEKRPAKAPAKKAPAKKAP